MSNPKQTAGANEMSLHTIRQENTMSSREIAAVTGKEHRNVKLDIKRILKEAEIDAQGFLHIFLDTMNREQTEYRLPKRECDLVVSGYSVKYRLAIIDRWHELEATHQTALPKDYSQALRMLADEVEAKQQLAIENEKQRHSLKNKDHLILASNEASIKAGEILVREFAKSIDVIEVGQNKMYDWLKQQGYIMESKEPYQRYINLGWFTWKPSKDEINGKYRYTLRITPRGKVKLAAKYLDHIEAVEMGEAA